jgi:hypothetical protein
MDQPQMKANESQLEALRKAPYVLVKRKHFERIQNALNEIPCYQFRDGSNSYKLAAEISLEDDHYLTLVEVIRQVCGYISTCDNEWDDFRENPSEQHILLLANSVEEQVLGLLIDWKVFEEYLKDDPAETEFEAKIVKVAWFSEQSGSFGAVKLVRNDGEKFYYLGMVPGIHEVADARRVAQLGCRIRDEEQGEALVKSGQEMKIQMGEWIP